MIHGMYDSLNTMIYSSFCNPIFVNVNSCKCTIRVFRANIFTLIGNSVWKSKQEACVWLSLYSLFYMQNTSKNETVNVQILYIFYSTTVKQGILLFCFLYPLKYTEII